MFFSSALSSSLSTKPIFSNSFTRNSAWSTGAAGPARAAGKPCEEPSEEPSEGAAEAAGEAFFRMGSKASNIL